MYNAALFDVYHPLQKWWGPIFFLGVGVSLGFQIWALVWTAMNDCTSTAYWIFSIINFSAYCVFQAIIVGAFLIVFLTSVIRNLPKREKKPAKASHVTNRPSIRESKDREGEGEESERDETVEKLVPKTDKGEGKPTEAPPKSENSGKEETKHDKDEEPQDEYEEGDDEEIY